MPDSSEEERPPGTFVVGNGIIYYLGRNYTATVVNNQGSQSTPLGRFFYLTRNHAAFRQERTIFAVVPGCPVLVRKYVREEYRA